MDGAEDGGLPRSRGKEGHARRWWAPTSLNGLSARDSSQGSRRDHKIKRSWKREVELDPQLSPEEIVSREVELG